MSTLPSSEKLTVEQSDTLEKAAYKIITARNEASEMLTRSGVRPAREDEEGDGWFRSPCGALLLPPPSHHPCGCPNYTGNGGPCSKTFRDLLGPDLGSTPIRTCGHRASQHMQL